MISYKILLSTTFLLLQCQTGQLEVVCNLPKSLTEVSGIAMDSKNNVFWMIEDQGNSDHIFGLNEEGKIVYDLNMNKKVKNRDWEDILIDTNGILYVGDFGNNSKKDRSRTIYKVTPDISSANALPAEEIKFNLPKDSKPMDFEAFILYQNSFFLFAKKSKKTVVWKIPNAPGTHEATFVQEYIFEDADSAITSAALSPDQQTIVLLNHEKLYLLRAFTTTDFFSGSVQKIEFDHSSQKEGICFKDYRTVYITDERNNNEGGNLYAFVLD